MQDMLSFPAKEAEQIIAAHDGDVALLGLCLGLSGCYIAPDDIEKNDIRIKLMYLLDCLRTRTGFTQNFQFARIRFEQRAHAHTSKRFIIGYQDSKQFFSPLLVNLFIETHHDGF